ncbi:MAG: CDP-glucose 4,6-dehydratase [Gammaproteobacteria bacterium]|nr:CDP-glucose 4,6-dehydratase [Gammaproteobacteria bacterium]MCH9743844.1 CDP-glucose 4,6-dehydratase [Gammaproteobacteria bacterium]
MKVDFWKGKTVLVTGHAGFKGTWLCLLLKKMGARVIGYGHLPKKVPNMYQAVNLDKCIEASIEGDVTDLEKLVAVISEHKPDVLFHLAAQAFVPFSYAHPAETIEANVMGTTILLEAIRKAQPTHAIGAIVNVTTDKCYENCEQEAGYRENDILGGTDPYSVSKACSELITRTYRSSYGIPVATARAGNVIAGGDWSPGRLIPNIVRAIMAEDAAERSIQLSNSQSVRPWQHVLDALHGYVVLAEAVHTKPGTYKYEQAWNFGPPEGSRSLSVGAITEEFLSTWGASLAGRVVIKREEDITRGKETITLKLVTIKSTDYLNWKPIVDSKEMLAMTSEWYHSFYNGRVALEVTNNQIDRFMALYLERNPSPLSEGRVSPVHNASSLFHPSGNGVPGASSLVVTANECRH